MRDPVETALLNLRKHTVTNVLRLSWGAVETEVDKRRDDSSTVAERYAKAIEAVQRGRATTPAPARQWQNRRQNYQSQAHERQRPKSPTSGRPKSPNQGNGRGGAPRRQ